MFVIPATLAKLRSALQNEGYDLRLVGGCVRDMLIGVIPKDLDLCTDAHPAKVMLVSTAIGLNVYPTGVEHGTVTVMGEEGEPYEITTLRLDVETDGRHATVAFTNDWEADLARRDLTINAMAMTFDGAIIDPFDGQTDLVDRRVRFVGNPADRVQEDYLRILRFFRFAARFGGELDDASLEACRVHAKGLRFISAERISAEMTKILSFSHKVVPDIIRIMHGNGILQEIGLTGAISYDNFADVCVDTANPITRLVGLCETTGQDPREVATAWKWSNADKALATYLWTETYTSACPYTYDLVIKGYTKEWVAERIKLEGHTEYLSELQGDVFPSFPVNGRDILALGYKGPDVGKILNAMKESWYWGGMDATKEDLINQVLGL